MSHTYREITHQPDAVRGALAAASRWPGTPKAEDFDRLIVTGCGTSFWLSQAAAASIRTLGGIDARAIPASELLLWPDRMLSGAQSPWVVGISRSGTTSEVVHVLEWARKERNIPSLAVTCHPESDLAKGASSVVAVPEAREESVVMTRSFTSMLVALQSLAGRWAKDEKAQAELAALPDHLTEVVARTSDLAEKIVGAKGFGRHTFLGMGPYLGLANEAMLKMEEMTQLPVKSYSSLEFRHGPISVVDEQMAVTILMSEQSAPLEKPLVSELLAQGATVVALAPEKTLAAMQDMSAGRFHQVALPEGFSDITRMALYMPFLQYLAYYQALALHLDPDRPRNLTQVVRVDIHR